ncbi:MAG: hypothetical protein IV093_13205 [Rubrivivax sp.]|nr:hypothetical protein [Rubrivivax sp.]
MLLKRQLRELKPLTERGARYEIKGRPVIDLTTTDNHIEARLARRPATSPEWTAEQLTCPPDVRRFVDTVKKRLQQWEREE